MTEKTIIATLKAIAEEQKGGKEVITYQVIGDGRDYPDFITAWPDHETGDLPGPDMELVKGRQYAWTVNAKPKGEGKKGEYLDFLAVGYADVATVKSDSRGRKEAPSTPAARQDEGQGLPAASREGLSMSQGMAWGNALSNAFGTVHGLGVEIALEDWEKLITLARAIYHAMPEPAEEPGEETLIDTLAQPQDAPKPPAGPYIPKLTYEDVLVRAESEGLDQKAFEIQVLGKSLDAFQKVTGASPEIANKILTRYLAKKEAT